MDRRESRSKGGRQVPLNRRGCGRHRLKERILIAKVRRSSQIVCFLLFFWMLGQGHSRVFANPFLTTDSLVVLVNAVAGRVVGWRLLWPLAILIPTLFVGRFFCGWICPMGSVNHFLSYLGAKSWPHAASTSKRFRNLRAAKYFILIAGIVAALLGSSLLGWFDPLSLLVRSVSVHLLPAAASQRYAPVPQPHYAAGLVLVLAFVALLASNLRATRFWCGVLCPLGALLGVVSRYSRLKLHKDTGTCNGCGKCNLLCQGGAHPWGGETWRKTECHLCLNCTATCPNHSLSFRLCDCGGLSKQPNMSRRSAMMAAAAGFVALPIVRTAHASRSPVVRPPGARREMEFLARCIRCGACMKICPNNALQPSLTEAGLAGFWSPMLTPQVGYCEPDCVRCTEVCPTGAISHLTRDQKGWQAAATSAPLRVGLAVYDRTRCLPWASGSECAVCVEWCPVSPKAIYLEAATPNDSVDKWTAAKRPIVDPVRCVGCGACEYACPLDVAAVRITGV